MAWLVEKITRYNWVIDGMINLMVYGTIGVITLICLYRFVLFMLG